MSPLEKINEQVIYSKPYEIFNIGSIVHTCTISTFALYTLCQCLIQWQKIDIHKTKSMHMGELPCSNVMPKEKGGSETQYRFLFIIIVVGHPINMYEVIKLNGMSA